MARQNFIGFVVSQGRMDKTIKVRVMQRVFDRSIQKELLKKKDYLVHDESNICREGDLVRIEATRPLSARKFFAVAEIKKNKGQQFAKYQSEAKVRVREEENGKMKDFVRRRAINDRLVQNELYADLDSVKALRGKAEYSEEEVAQLAQLREKYGISSWDEMQNQELFQSDIAHVKQKIEDIQQKLKIAQELEAVLAEPEGELYKKICEEMKIGPETKRNVRKNLVRKYLSTHQ